MDATQSHKRRQVSTTISSSVPMDTTEPPRNLTERAVKLAYSTPHTGRRHFGWHMLNLRLYITGLSSTSGLSREQRSRKTIIGTEVAHVSRDLDTTYFKVKRSRSPDRFTQRGLNAWSRQVQRWPWERIGREKLLLCCVCSAALGHPRGIVAGAYRVTKHSFW